MGKRDAREREEPSAVLISTEAPGVSTRRLGVARWPQRYVPRGEKTTWLLRRIAEVTRRPGSLLNALCSGLEFHPGSP